MIVDFPAPEGPTSAVTVPGADMKRNIVQHRLPGFIGEADVFEIHSRPRTVPIATVRRGSGLPPELRAQIPRPL